MSNWGGPRPNAGRLQQRFRLTPEAARAWRELAARLGASDTLALMNAIARWWQADPDTVTLALAMVKETTTTMYVILLETTHGHRYWRTSSDPDSASDFRKRVIGPVDIGDDDPDALAPVIADNYGVDLDEPDTWDFSCD